MSYSSHPMLRRYYAINEHLGSFSYEDLTQRISDLEAQLAARPSPARDDSERVKDLTKENRKIALRSRKKEKENKRLQEIIRHLKDTVAECEGEKQELEKKLAECETEKKTCEEAKENMQQELQGLLQRLVQATVVAVDPPPNVDPVSLTEKAKKLQQDTIERMQSTVDDIPEARAANVFDRLKNWFLGKGRFPVAVPAAPAK